MGDTTTVRVTLRTREQLNRVSAETGETVDSTIRRGLQLIERDARRAQAVLDARTAAADPADRDEVAAAVRDLSGE